MRKVKVLWVGNQMGGKRERTINDWITSNDVVPISISTDPKDKYVYLSSI